MRAQVLDRLLLYLRLVHSVDYYNFCEYPAEDEMPHRCGLIHVRGPLPVGKITPAEGRQARAAHARACAGPAEGCDAAVCCDWTVSEHQKMCEERLAPLLNPSDTLSEEDAAKLGKKVPEQEVGLASAATAPRGRPPDVCVCVCRWRSSCQPTRWSSVKTNGCVL